MVTWLRYRGVVSQGLGRWRLASRVFRCVEMYPPELVRLCRGSGVGEELGGVGGRTC